jgi:hypothetical protein
VGRRDGPNDAAAQLAAHQASRVTSWPGRVTRQPGRVTCQPGRVNPRLGNSQTVQYDPSATAQAPPEIDEIEKEIWEKEDNQLF